MKVGESVICFNIKCVTNCKKYERVVQCLMRTHFVTNEGVRNGQSGDDESGRGGAADDSVEGRQREHIAGIERVSWQIAMGRLQNIAGN